MNALLRQLRIGDIVTLKSLNGQFLQASPPSMEFDDVLSYSAFELHTGYLRTS